ncbi:hypothetical protein Hanom_Chr08g00720941 [Helianthus anomalus]
MPRRWDPDRECYLDPKENICVEPSSVDIETLIKLISETEEQNKINAAKKAEKERLESKKVDIGIINTTKENDGRKSDENGRPSLMEKALEVDSKSASSSESSSKVSSSGSNNESGKTDCANIESVCRNCMKECKVCNTHAYLSNKRIQDLVEKVGKIEKEIVNRDKLVKASSERIKELSEKIEKDKEF